MDLLKNEALFLEVFMHNPIPIFLIDLSTQGFLLANNAATNRYGYTQDEFKKMTVFDLYPCDEHAKLSAYFKTRTDNYKKSSEWIHLSKDGRKINVQVISHRFVLDDLTVVLSLAMDISEKAGIMQELEESNKRYLSIIESQGELVCRFLPDTTLTFVNQAYCKAFGKTEEELIGTKFLQLIPVGQRNQSLNVIKQLCPENNIITSTHDAILADGSIGWQEWTDIALFDEEGKIKEIQGVGRDISNYKNTETTLRNALNLEKHLTDLKTRLLYMASHEFKVPLSTIMATAETIQSYYDKMDQDEVVQCAEKIIQQASYLNEVVQDVLLVAKEQTGKLLFEPREYEIISFLRDVAEEYEMSHSDKQSLELDLPKGEFRFTFDHKLMYKIVNNLLSNAVKFSKQDTVIRISLEVFDSELVLTVADSGCGIPDNQKAQLFEPFFRGDNVQAISGTGLGLPIVKEAVELHSGSIEIDSTQGRGTRVALKFPLNKS